MATMAKEPAIYSSSVCADNAGELVRKLTASDLADLMEVLPRNLKALLERPEPPAAAAGRPY